MFFQLLKIFLYFPILLIRILLNNIKTILRYFSLSFSSLGRRNSRYGR